jgi:hypothetical protein
MKALLFLLIALVTLTSVICGAMMISDPAAKALAIPPDTLLFTPFSNFKIPGLLILLVVGIPGVLAIYYHITQNRWKNNAGILLGATTGLWILGQVIFTQSLHWQDFAMFGVAMLIILLSYQVKGSWVV